MKNPPPRDIPPGRLAWVSAAQIEAFERSGTTAHRLGSAHDRWCERFGADLLLSYKSEAAREMLLSELTAWCSTSGFSARRIFGKLLPRENADRVAPTLLSGSAGEPLTTIVEEHSVRFGLDFAAGYSAGLFIDQRANRACVRHRRPKRLLNTFAYTCSFSVVAALAGAETLSIDLSRKSLDRGEENFRLNDLALAPHRFLADDVLDVLPRLARRGEQFDAVVLDPPTFSRGAKGRKFQVERDFEALLQAALEVATPDAAILLSTNCTRLIRRDLERIGRHCLKLTRRAATFHIEPDLPDIPVEFAPQTLWMMMR
jgi:23S rRNA (cytosine1962-C5)-methyltransferase